jgi:hypothetical protein
MPTSASQSWSRGFSPLFRGPDADQHLRISDADRPGGADRLAEHYGDGRLDKAEFDERVGRAMSAKTRADLNGLFDDLPDTSGPSQAGAQGAQGSPAMPVSPRRRHRHPVLLVVLGVIAAMAVIHAVAVPWLWIGFLVAVVAFATRGARHSHASQDS